MDKNSSRLRIWLIGIAAVIRLGLFTWLVGALFNWSWGDFWLSFISNAASGAIIGFVLYWIITRPDEKKARQQRQNQALAMLKTEFKINLDRAKIYGNALKNLQTILHNSTLYGLHVELGMRLRKADFFLNLTTWNLCMNYCEQMKR